MHVVGRLGWVRAKGGEGDTEKGREGASSVSQRCKKTNRQREAAAKKQPCSRRVGRPRVRMQELAKISWLPESASKESKGIDH